jgi:hypothetical protein
MSKQISERQYIINNVRKLPIAECYINTNWKESQQATILITRKMSGDYYCVAIFLVDLMCLGAKDCFYRIRIDADEYNAFIKRHLSDPHTPSIKADYTLVHNIIYEAVEFALSFGFQPHKDYALAKYFLQEDTDDIEMIHIPVGYEGTEVPAIFSSPEQPYTRQIELLNRKLGKGNFHLFIMDNEGEIASENQVDEDLDDVFDLNQDPELLYPEGINGKNHDYENKEYPHLLTDTNYGELIINDCKAKNHPNAEKIAFLIDEFSKDPYSSVSKPFADDILYKIYDLVTPDIQTIPEIITQFDIWNQSIEIIEEDYDIHSESLSPKVNEMFEKIEKAVRTENTTKIAKAIKELEKIPEEQKTENYFDTLLDILSGAKEGHESIAEAYYKKFPSVYSKLLYINTLALDFKVKKLENILGNWTCVSDIVGSNKMTAREISIFFRFLVLYYTLTELKYLPEVMKVIKNTPNSLKEDIYGWLELPPLSLIAKFECLKKISNHLVDYKSKS